MSIPFLTSLPIQPSEIDQFSEVDFAWNPTRTQFQALKKIPEQQVKEVFCNNLGEAEIPTDWGGEECDIFTSNLSIGGRRRTAAFMLKGPARFHEIRMADCGRNGDQICRLFNTPADVCVVQHCHTISPAVRKTVHAFAAAQFSNSVRYCLIDGYDTARILRSSGVDLG